MAERLDCAVIGAGVVGLAVARALARAGREVVVLEAASLIGSETSSRNSEIIHAGIYYPTGSLKARLCVAGKQLLYRYCESHGIPHRRCGKFIVAADKADRAKLEEIKDRAAANGVDDLDWQTPAQVAALEPAVRCEVALVSPSTGMIDSHAYMLALQGDAEAAGAMLAFNARVAGGAVEADGIRLTVEGEASMDLLCSTVVNSAGLDAPGLARHLKGLDPATVPQDYLAKGNYFSLTGRSPFARPVYPVPEPGGLGVHVTVDMAGQARFGPDVEWVTTRDYDVDPARAEKFYAAIRRYWPDLPDGALQPAYCGLRPKLSGPGEPNADFVIQTDRAHGVPGLVNLYGIESPGLTCSLAIAEEVADHLAAAEPRRLIA